MGSLAAWLLVTTRRNRRDSKDLQNQRRRPWYGLKALACKKQFPFAQTPGESLASGSLNSYLAELQLNDSAPEGDGGCLRAIPHVQLFENVGNGLRRSH